MIQIHLSLSIERLINIVLLLSIANSKRTRLIFSLSLAALCITHFLIKVYSILLLERRRNAALSLSFPLPHPEKTSSVLCKLSHSQLYEYRTVVFMLSLKSILKTLTVINTWLSRLSNFISFYLCTN